MGSNFPNSENEDDLSIFEEAPFDSIMSVFRGSFHDGHEVTLSEHVEAAYFGGTKGFGRSLESSDSHRQRSDDKNSSDNDENEDENESNDKENESEMLSVDSSRQCSILEFRRQCGALVNNERLQAVILILIVINSIIMGIGTFDIITENSTPRSLFDVIDRVFLTIFTIELALQFIYHSLALFQDGWLVFDFVIIVFSWAFESFQVIRAFRIFRALRIITRVETLRSLINAIFAVLPRLIAIGLLLLLVFYIFAVMLTTLFKDATTLSHDYFTRLDNTLFTLLQFMTLDFANVTREIMVEYRWAYIPITAFVSISGFIVFNLIIAVICDAVAILERASRAADKPIKSILYADEAKAHEVRIQARAKAHSKIVGLSRQLVVLRQRQEQMIEQLDIVARQFQRLNSPPPGDSIWNYSFDDSDSDDDDDDDNNDNDDDDDNTPEQ